MLGCPVLIKTVKESCELKRTFLEKASDPKLRLKIVDSCRFRFGLSKIAASDYGEIVYRRIMYEAGHSTTEQEYDT